MSVILYAGDCSKQVINITINAFYFNFLSIIIGVPRLQKLNICTSYETTNLLLNEVGKNHDSAVFAWRDTLIEELRSKESEVS